ncbi:hypothetical protein ACLEC1_10235 [Lonsdalea quercina]
MAYKAVICCDYNVLRNITVGFVFEMKRSQSKHQKFILNGVVFKEA